MIIRAISLLFILFSCTVAFADEPSDACGKFWENQVQEISDFSYGAITEENLIFFSSLDGVVYNCLNNTVSREIFSTVSRAIAFDILWLSREENFIHNITCAETYFQVGHLDVAVLFLPETLDYKWPPVCSSRLGHSIERLRQYSKDN